MSEHEAAEAAGLQQLLSSSAHLQLPDFWPNTPQAWFIFAGSKFPVKGVLSAPDRFNLVIISLPKESLRRVIDVLESPDDAPAVERKSAKRPEGKIQKII
jgi:hypothetical protein